MKHKNSNTLDHFLIAFTTALLIAATGVNARETTRVSIDPAGAQLAGMIISSAISVDGRYVVFDNYFSSPDIYDTEFFNVRDRVAGKTTTFFSWRYGSTTAISADGRYVTAWAGGLDDNSLVFDLVNKSASGLGLYRHPTAISANGRYVAFNTPSTWENLYPGDTNGWDDAFVYDVITGNVTLVSGGLAGAQGNGHSYATGISADGRYVVFQSRASNLVAGDTNGMCDIFVRDRVTATTTRISVGSVGTQGNSHSCGGRISADGRYVAFWSAANNLVTGDTNGKIDVFVRDRFTGTTTRVSVGPAGVQGNGGSNVGAISADGRYVAFYSDASNLVAGDTNVRSDAFVRDRINATTTRISVNSAGAQGNGGSNPTAISADGRYVAFDSASTNLVAGDTNGVNDAFVHDRLLDTSHSANLQATVTARPASVRRGLTASYILTVKNNGPASAGNVALTDIILNGTVTSMTPSQGSCSRATVSVCNLLTLAAGASARVTVNIRADANPLTQQISVNAAPRDSVPGNNAIKIITPVTP